MRQVKITTSITNRDDASTNKYLLDISKYTKGLSIEEEVELGKKIRETGDQEAIDKLVKSNLRFVVSVAKQYQNSGLALGDLINEGNYGLLKAAQRYDETRGFKFISYAVWRIRQSILVAISEQERTVRLPLNKVSQKSKIFELSAKLEQEHEREPSIEELKEALAESGINITSYEISQALGNSDRGLSFDRDFAGQEEGNSLYDVIPDKSLPETSHLVDKDSNSSLLVRLIETLDNSREREILTHLFGINGAEKIDPEVLADRYNLSKERVRQIKEKAIKKLRAKVRFNPGLKSEYFS